MGRGRAKAKQTRIARDLKYFSPPTDFAALQHELGSSSQPVEQHADHAAASSGDGEHAER
ncbi:DUF3073 domain-containing protein [Dactylosporangium sp. CA-233914]|uniref:DUF3073 domain-containing protein n=1 Tax=Dactylosporangium sp. CA-233914 TaxID=3239934 RepID=UPI003D8C8A72